MRKITRSNIDKNNMVALGYCQCQTILNMFAYNYKVGYNSGIYGWNYDLYCINGMDVVAGYHVPYDQYSNEKIKNKLVALENEIRNSHEWSQYEKYKNKFLEIFE